MTSHWLRRPGPWTWPLLALTAALAVVAVVLHLTGEGGSAPGSWRNVFVLATFVSGFVTYLSARGRP